MSFPTNKELSIARFESDKTGSLDFSACSLARFIKSYERSKKKILVKAGVIAGALALSTTMVNVEVGQALAGALRSDGVPNVPMRSVASASGQLAPAKWTGVLEDAGKQPTLSAAERNMDLVQALVPSDPDNSRNVYIKESLWVSPGQIGPDETDFANLENSIKAAESDNYNVCLAVWPFTWGRGKDHLPPPLGSSKQWQYTTFLATIANRLRKDFGTDPVKCWSIGNEPNSSTFWWPQFAPDGTDAAAPTYEKLLARSYDTLKAISPDFVVIGGELASHGDNDPHAKRKNHSPEAFIRDMGKAYRDSGRTKPIMDIFGYHPYGLNSSDSPATVHNDPNIIGVGDYDRLVKDLGQAFDGTTQKGSKLPILYSEYGNESRTYGPQGYRYNHNEPKTSGAVQEVVQGENYNTYLKLAACQPNVIGAFIFHTMDERDRRGWQSGPYYADGSPKTSQPVVADAMQRLSSGEDQCIK